MDEVDRHRGQAKKLEGAAVWWAAGCPGADIEEGVQELRAQGWDEDAIEIERAEAAELAEPGLVWPENETIAKVFIACRWTKVMGLEKLIYDDISTQEIVSALVLYRIPRAQWIDHFEGVRLMAAASRPVYNEAD